MVELDSGVTLATRGGRGSVVGNPVVRLVLGGTETGKKWQDMNSLDKHVCAWIHAGISYSNNRFFLKNE